MVFFGCVNFDLLAVCYCDVLVCVLGAGRIVVSLDKSRVDLEFICVCVYCVS
jgi:hypothetical protein